MKLKNILIITFNEFQFDGCSYMKQRFTENNELYDQYEFARKPRAAIYDEVWENGSGGHDHWAAHRAKRIYRHGLLKN